MHDRWTRRYLDHPSLSATTENTTHTTTTQEQHMSTPIGAPPQAATPSAKLRTIGDYIDCALVNEEVVPWIEFGTDGVAKIGKDGKPRTQDKVTAVVIGGTGVTTRDDVDTPVVADDTITLYLSGPRRWDWIQAKKAHGQLLRGDVLRVKYDHDEPSATKGYNARKVWTFQLRHAKPGEEARTALCEQVAAGAATPIGGHDADPEPF